MGPARVGVLLVEAEDGEHVDQRGVEVARRELECLASARQRVRDDAEGVATGLIEEVDAHGAPPAHAAGPATARAGTHAPSASICIPIVNSLPHPSATRAIRRHY
jgi:hypothetical protein